MKLSRAERRLATVLFDHIVPGGVNPRLPLSASQAGVVDFFEEHLDYLPARTRWALRGAVAFLGGYASTAGRLHPRGAQGALELLANSPLYLMRESVTLLKSVVCLGYFTNPSVRETLGLDLKP